MNPKKQNLMVRERASIKSLQLDTTITIKPADKGGAVVVMDTCDYIKEAEQLSDVKYYKGVSTDLTAEHTARINTYLEGLTLKGEINNKVKRKLITTSSQTPHLYLLPKIHKGVTPPPGHPIDIVSANGCATEKISALTDMILRPLVPKTPSYIKDTGHFLQILRKMGNNLPPDTLRTVYPRCELTLHQYSEWGGPTSSWLLALPISAAE